MRTKISSAGCRILSFHFTAQPIRATLSSAARTLRSLLNRELRALVLALLLGVTATAQAQTASNRFIPTFLVYYGGGAQLVASDAAKLAKFDLIDIDRFRYNQIGSNTWAAIKALNPNTRIYLYEMGPEAPSHLDSTLPLYLNGLGRYNVSRGHPMGSLNGNHPGLFQRDAAGNRIYSVGFSNPGAGQYWYLMDFGSSAYQSYWVSAVKADIVDQPWVADGVFVDNCLSSAAAGGYSAASAWYASNASWSAAMNSFVTAISAGMHGHGQKLWCNKGDTRFADGVAAWLALDASATPPDVLLEEGAFAVEWGADTQFFPEAEWKRQVDIMAQMKNSKVALMSHTKLMEGQTGTDNWGKPVTFWQTLWYSMGSFLLGKNDAPGNSYFMFNGGSGYNRIWWFDEYDRIDLGKALAPYSVKSVGGVNIYSREFEKGFVFVNPTANNVSSIALAQPLRQITHGNLLTAFDTIPAISSFGLNGHTAAVFLKTTVDSGSDTIAPSVPTGLSATPVSSTQIDLKWNASTDNVAVAGYVVYLDNVSLGTTTTTSFRHSGLTPGASYNYRVSAYDAVPNHSAWTAAVSATTTSADTQAPSVPSGFAATAISSTAIELKWTASTDNVGVSEYYVYVNDTALTTTTGTSFVHTGLVAGTTYNYRVSAYDAVPNHSAWTAPLSVTTVTPDTQAPTAPTGLTATAVSATQIDLKWNASSDNVGVTGYYVYLNDIPLTTTTGTSFQHTGLVAGTAYNYRVSAYDAVPNHSAWTAPVSAMPFASLAITSFQSSGNNRNVYYSLGYSGTPVRIQVFLDTDKTAGTGYPVGGIGANYLVEIAGGYGNLYAYSGSGGSWSWRLVKAVAYTNANGVANIAVARKDLGSPAVIDVIGAIADGTTILYTTKYTH